MKEKVKLIFATVFCVLAILFFLGSHSGVFGVVGVRGNSMASLYPEGSRVVVVPAKLFHPHENDDVVAFYQGEKQADLPLDRQPGLIVKRMRGGYLVGVDDGSRYQTKDIRGLVVASIPLQKILWWTNTGTQNPAPKILQATASERKRVADKANRELILQLIKAEQGSQKKRMLRFHWLSCQPMKKSIPLNIYNVKAVYVKLSIDAEAIVTFKYRDTNTVSKEEKFIPRDRVVVFFPKKKEIISYTIFIDGYGSNFDGETGIFFMKQ